MKKEQTSGGVKPAAATGGPGGGGGGTNNVSMTKVPTPDGVKSNDNNDDVGNTPIGTPMGSVASAGGPADR